MFFAIYLGKKSIQLRNERKKIRIAGVCANELNHYDAFDSETFSIISISDFMTLFTCISVLSSVILFPFTFVFANEITTCELSGISHSITLSVSIKLACPLKPCEDAVINATGLCEKAIEETVQSIAFFNVPGTPIAYSGVQMSTPSASLIFFRNNTTSFGTSSLSKSGLKWG